jgi:hypothetical protein
MGQKRRQKLRLKRRKMDSNTFERTKEGRKRERDQENSRAGVLMLVRLSDCVESASCLLAGSIREYDQSAE